jgi:hypothetical protein
LSSPSLPTPFSHPAKKTKEPKYPYNGGIPYVLETSHSSFTPINSDKGVEEDIEFNSPPPRKTLKNNYIKESKHDQQKMGSTKRNWLEFDEHLSSDDELAFLQGKGKAKGMSLHTRVNLGCVLICS